MNTQPKTPIATIGLEKSHLGILEFLISYYFKDDFYLTKHKDENEQVCIFHIKSDGDYKALINYKEQNRTALIIAITKNKIDDENIETITFPFSPRKVSDVLHKVKRKIDKKTLSIQDHTNNTQLKKSKKTTTKTENKTHTFKTSKEKNNKKKKKLKKEEVKKSAVKKTSNNNQKKIITTLIEKNESKKNESKTNIDDLHEVINKTHPDFSLSNIEKIPTPPLAKPDIKKITAIKNKSGHNKNKQIVIKKDSLKFSASRADINLNNPTIVANLVYPTDKYLQGELTRLYVKAKREDKITTLDTSYGMISYNPKNHKAFVNVNNITLQNISSIANLRGKYLSMFTNDTSDKNWENADALLWKTTIWASRGRLPVGTNIDDPFVLKHWPNLTRFMMTPHAMEITALWVHEPITLRKTITLLAIPQRTVFSFYSAVIALDLVIISPTKTQKNRDKNTKIQPIVSKPTKKKKKGFFSKLLNYFKPDNIEEI